MLRGPNVTESTRSEGEPVNTGIASLPESAGWLLNLFEQSPFGLVVTDIEGVIRGANRQASKLLLPGERTSRAVWARGAATSSAIRSASMRVKLATAPAWSGAPWSPAVRFPRPASRSTWAARGTRSGSPHRQSRAKSRGWWSTCAQKIRASATGVAASTRGRGARARVVPHASHPHLGANAGRGSRERPRRGVATAPPGTVARVPPLHPSRSRHHRTDLRGPLAGGGATVEQRQRPSPSARAAGETGAGTRCRQTVTIHSHPARWIHAPSRASVDRRR